MDDLVIVTGKWTHRLASTEAGSAIRAKCRREAGAPYQLIKDVGPTPPRCPDCFPNDEEPPASRS